MCLVLVMNRVDVSHLMGMFYRTLRIIDNGIKPCYVFDGAPPKLKNGEVNHPISISSSTPPSYYLSFPYSPVSLLDSFSISSPPIPTQHSPPSQHFPSNLPKVLVALTSLRSPPQLLLL